MEAELVRALIDCEPRIRAFFRHRCPEAADAEDLTQECLLAILESYARFSGRSRVSTWVYAIARNVHRNHLYYADRNRRLLVKLGESAPAHTEEERAEVRLVVGNLRPVDQHLYRLFYVEARPVREIAAVLGRPEGTVKYQLYRLRKHVGRLLGGGREHSGTTGARHVSG